MATTIDAYSSFPYTNRLTLSAGGANVATLVTLPDVPYPVVVSLKPITNVVNLGGGNLGAADGGSLTTGYDSLPADRWSKMIIAGHIDGISRPNFVVASGTTSTALEIHIVPYVAALGVK